MAQRSISFIVQNLPSFEWISLNISDKIGLEIDFHDGSPPDTAILSSLDNINHFLSSYLIDNDCIFYGHLKGDPDSSVSVSGCPWAKNYQVCYFTYLCQDTKTDNGNSW